MNVFVKLEWLGVWDKLREAVLSGGVPLEKDQLVAYMDGLERHMVRQAQQAIEELQNNG